MCVITDCCGLKALKDEDVSFQVCGYKKLQSASASTFQDGVGRSCLWDLADATTNSSGCWRSHALATQISRTCSVNTISPLNTQMLYTMKVLMQPQPTSSTSSSFGRQNVVKRNFNFILVTAHTHDKQSCSAEKACVQASLSPSAFPCTPFGLPGAVIHQATALEGGSSLVAYALQAALPSQPQARGREKLLPHSRPMDPLLIHPKHLGGKMPHSPLWDRTSQRRWGG